LFRKQGIDISSGRSFELPARLRIIVRVLSRNRASFAFYPCALSLSLSLALSLSLSFARSCGLPSSLGGRALCVVRFSLYPFPSYSPGFPPPPSPAARARAHTYPNSRLDYWSIYPARLSLYFIRSSRMKRRRKTASSKRERLSLSPYPSFHAVALAVDPSGFRSPARHFG